MADHPLDTAQAVRTLRQLKGPALHCLVALVIAQADVVEPKWIRRATGYSQESVAEGLGGLEAIDLARPVGRFGWQLTARARQLPLPFDQLLTGPALAPLQAGSPAGADPAGDKLSTVTPLLAESRILISFKESDPLRVDSNNKNTGEATPLLAESRGNGSARHIAEVVKALKNKGRPIFADDDPLPPDLRVAVDNLVVLGCPRRRAELAVARSPWGAADLILEIGRWKARLLSPEGKTITPSGFPYLLAARLEKGERCPLALRLDDGAKPVNQCQVCGFIAGEHADNCPHYPA